LVSYRQYALTKQTDQCAGRVVQTASWTAADLMMWQRA